ncbi:hypothetical protein [Streptomyces sp. NPDC049879]|uniref:hypothetical protein n=1 Tax=Streptomyces sp. NPDC049879 TaxID=3365598 RepID=UPI0037A2E3A4
MLRGDPARPPFALFHLRQRQVRAVETVNAPRTGRRVVPELLADQAVDMRDAGRDPLPPNTRDARSRPASAVRRADQDGGPGGRRPSVRSQPRNSCRASA